MPLTRGPAPSSVDEDLSQLERDVRAFKIEYEQYFGGGRPRPPTDTEWRIEQILKRYGERPGEISYAQRFRFNNLAQTYAKFREIFRKRLKQREEGTVQRHYGAAARAIEKERAETDPGREVPPGSEERPAAVIASISDPARELREVEKLYTAFRKAQQKAGDSSHALGRGEFLEFLQRKTKELRKGTKAVPVEYSVVVEGGKARLQARVKK